MTLFAPITLVCLGFAVALAFTLLAESWYRRPVRIQMPEPDALPPTTEGPSRERGLRGAR